VTSMGGAPSISPAGQRPGRGRLVEALHAVRAERALLSWWCDDHERANSGCPIWQEWFPAGSDELVIDRDGRIIAWVVLEQRCGPVGWYLWPARRMLCGSESGQHYCNAARDDMLQVRNATAVCAPTFVAPPVACAALAAEAAMDVVAARVAADAARGLLPFAAGPRIPAPGEGGAAGAALANLYTAPPDCCDCGCDDPLTWNRLRWCTLPADHAAA
jgi:hypothetical protein